MATARQLAAEALLRVEQDGAYSNIALDKKLEQYQKNAGKDGEARARSEAAFASTLFYGVLERRLTLDCCIENYAAKGLCFKFSGWPFTSCCLCPTSPKARWSTRR